MNNTLTALTGVKVGHATDAENLTGCTVILFDKKYPVVSKSYGGAPGTFNTDISTNGKSFDERNAIFIAGGSLTGLMSASDIMKGMIEKHIGDKDHKIINPNITGAIVFDLGVRVAQYDPSLGRKALDNVSSEPVKRGNVGAGTGTSVGKFQFLENGTKIPAIKAGVGCALINVGNGVIVTALSVVNALGNVVNPDGTILAGNRDTEKKFKTFDETSRFVTKDLMNTTISVVGVNIDLKTRENYEIVANIASHGQIRAINPVNTSIDGDTVFVFSTEENDRLLNDYGKYFKTSSWPLFDVDVVGQAAAKAVQESIYDAVFQAESISFEGAYNGIIPSVKDYK